MGSILRALAQRPKESRGTKRGWLAWFGGCQECERGFFSGIKAGLFAEDTPCMIMMSNNAALQRGPHGERTEGLAGQLPYAGPQGKSRPLT